eukprot:5677652-Amphidinium_carterae.1
MSESCSALHIARACGHAFDTLGLWCKELMRPALLRQHTACARPSFLTTAPAFGRAFCNHAQGYVS